MVKARLPQTGRANVRSGAESKRVLVITTQSRGVLRLEMLRTRVCFAGAKHRG
jgi:hypothetical protein